MQNKLRIKAAGHGKSDELTPFRWFMFASKTRTSQKSAGRKQVEHSITLQNLKDQWDHQNGVCPITGWQLILPKNSNGWYGDRSLKRASLDRKDSDKGYEIGNIQFISVMANLAKNNYSDTELIGFCKAVAQYHDVPRIMDRDITPPEVRISD